MTERTQELAVRALTAVEQDWQRYHTLKDQAVAWVTEAMDALREEFREVKDSS